MGRRKILLVEGLDDKRVIEELCRSRSIAALEIEQYEGIDRLLQSLPTRLALSQGDEILGVIVDADEDAGRRWQSIRTRLRASGYDNAPAVPAPNGHGKKNPAGPIAQRFLLAILIRMNPKQTRFLPG